MVKLSIPLIIVFLYIVLLFAISFYARHRASKNSDGFLLAGRELNTAMVAVNIAGVAVGAASTKTPSK
jgi:SSS family solute:Na+ symporter